MDIQNLLDGRRCYTLDGRVRIIIAKGGEDIPNNTFGFEVEFCSHDSSVFTFTHVDVATFSFAPPNLAQDEQDRVLKDPKFQWKIESDSGGVLELVTPPLRFSTVAEAQAFRARLIATMLDSLTRRNPIAGDEEVINGVLLGDWWISVFAELARLGQPDLTQPPLIHAERLATWEEVGRQLNEENVDDGINIPAARMRHLQNRGNWDRYVEGTVLSRSEKDWGAGYSSQLNMPMTLPGFFLYSKKKYDNAHKRIQDLEEWMADQDMIQLPAVMTTGSMRKNVDTWFWRTVLWKALEGYATRLQPRYAAGLWTAQNVAGWTLSTVRNLSMLYLIGSKVLTGALGALSEPDQLKLQKYAWLRNSTAVMNTDSPSEEWALDNALSELSQAPVSLDRNWLEYHSAMKDLTGLWFKGALFDVVLSEPTDILFMDRVGAMLENPLVNVWTPIFTDLIRRVKSRAWNEGLERIRPDYIDDLEDFDWATLVPKINQVEVALGRALRDVDGWDAFRMNSDRATRKFLHYADAPPWEGRYDTMYSPILNGVDWTYLVEHRFN